MKIFNTLSRKIEDFVPLDPPKVGMYICGPTVYDYAHLGHARTYANSDILVRALRWLNFSVKVVMNITDVGHLTSQADTGEDKMEKKAKQENKKAAEIADFYTTDFWQMTDALSITRPDIITPATKYIPEMIELIKKLETKGFTYKTDDGIYFNTSLFKTYGQMAQIDIAGLKAGWRVDRGQKKNPTDFALWKFSSKDEKRQMEWESPWGIGFPGWHIECSAMSLKNLGETLDIHTGGVDHIPIHHTNEICQSEAATGKQFVRYWFHSNFLDIAREKMSKSLGNFYRVNDLIKKGYDPMALRYLFLTAHYRTKMNFTFNALDGAQEAYKKLKSIVAGWQKETTRNYLSEEKLQRVQEYSRRFKEAVEADLAMPQALAIMWAMVKSNISSQDKLDLIKDWDQVLGLDLLKKIVIPSEIIKLIKLREELRIQKKWAEADELRQQIEAQGFSVIDKGV